ncbi:MAG: DUF427 domain-containing protein [Pseudomonas sp.]|nr:DUF427 domain-containing protein [Pseudomonas sp.]
MKLPGPDHPITLTPFKGRITVRFADEVVAQSDQAIKLQEASYPPVFYLPRESANLALYQQSQHQTHCPYKGDASYYDLMAGEQHSANVAWSYEAPYPAMQAIKGYLAFYPDKVSFEIQEHADPAG